MKEGDTQKYSNPLREPDMPPFVDDAAVAGMAEAPHMLPYTKLESHLLSRMDRMISKSFEIRDIVKKSGSIMYGVVNEQGKMADKYFDIDARLLYFVNKMIWNQHKFYGEGNERMTEAEKDIRDTQYKAHDEQSLSPKELSDLWNRL